MDIKDILKKNFDIDYDYDIWNECLIPEKTLIELKEFDDVISNLSDNAKIIEIGVRYGNFAIFLSKLADKYNKNISIIGIDLWEKCGNYGGIGDNSYAKMVNLLSKYKNIKLIQMDSTESAKLFNDNEIDVIIIDGDHRYDKVKSDINSWLPKLKGNGIMYCHDYNCKDFDVTRVVNEMFKNFKILDNNSKYGFAKIIKEK